MSLSNCYWLLYGQRVGRVHLEPTKQVIERPFASVGHGFSSASRYQLQKPHVVLQSVNQKRRDTTVC
jgi:hypothetical protein